MTVQSIEDPYYLNDSQDLWLKHTKNADSIYPSLFYDDTFANLKQQKPVY